MLVLPSVLQQKGHHRISRHTYVSPVSRSRSPNSNPLPTAAGWTSFIYSKCLPTLSHDHSPQIFTVWKGSLIVGNETIPSESFYTLVLSANQDETGVKMTSGDDDTQFILVCFVYNSSTDFTAYITTGCWRAS